MAFRFSHQDATVQDGVCRIALEQIDRALAEIVDPKLTETICIHQLRKRMKKLRGLIRLVRPGFPDYRVENAVMRDAARRLASLRDGDVMLTTFDRVIDREKLDPRRFTALANALAAAKTETPADASGVLDSVRCDLLALRERAGDWRLDRPGEDALIEGASKVYGRGRKAMKMARKDPEDAMFHDWRKRVKYHWYQTRILRPIAPKKFRKHARIAAELGEALGDHHDIGVCLAELARSPETPGDLLSEFDEAARRQQDELEDLAFACGHRLFRRTPSQLRSDWAEKWRDWRAT